MIGLLDWLESPRPDRGLHLARPDGGWAQTPYPDLQREVRRIAEQLRARRVPRGAIVSIMLTRERDFAAAFFGALLAGCTPSPLSTPLGFRDTRDYVDRVAAILRVAEPAVVLTDEVIESLALDSARAGAVEANGRSIVERIASGGGEPRELEGLRGARADLALVQFTSGSTGTPKGVRVSWENLEHNLHAIRSWLHWRDEDAVASWLPLYHDMGLIGNLLTPVTAGNDVWQLSPADFIRSPARWLECFGAHGATITASPNFGYGYAARRVAPEQLENLDFSRWRVAIVGSDRIDAAVLDRFARVLEPFGFARRTFAPAYGLAEATLAVTGAPPARAPRVVRLRTRRLVIGGRLEVQARSPISADAPAGTSLVGCGQAVSGAGVRIVDEEGSSLPESYFGEIVVSGASLADGYKRATGIERFETRDFATGDAGFIIDGELYVLGRICDSLKVRGRSVFAEDVELELARVDGVSAGRCVVVFGAAEGIDHATAVVESDDEAWLPDVIGLLHSRTDASVRITVVRAPRGTVQRTSSGKPRRRLIWRALGDGELAGEVIYDSEHEGRQAALATSGREDEQ